MRSLRFVVALVALVAFSGQSSAPFPIYAIVSQTGVSGPTGLLIMKTFDAAQAVVNASGGIKGRPIQFVIQDDASNPATTLQVANQLIAKSVPVVLGPSFAATCYAVVPLVKTGPVSYCFSNSLHPPAGSFAFSNGISTKDFIHAGLRFARSRGMLKIALLASNDSTGKDGEDMLAENLALPENKSIVLTDTEHFAPNDLTMSAQLAKIAGTKPDLLIIWASGTAFGNALHGVADGNVNAAVITHAGNINNVQMERLKEIAPKDLFFIAPPFLGNVQGAARKQAQQTFFAALRSVGLKPDAASALAWDPIMVTVDAYRHLGTGATAQQIHDYIEKLHGFPGLFGTLDFRDGNQHGAIGDEAIVVRYDDSQWVAVSQQGGQALKK